VQVVWEEEDEDWHVSHSPHGSQEGEDDEEDEHTLVHPQQELRLLRNQ
jgi:hypothetical protein